MMYPMYFLKLNINNNIKVNYNINNSNKNIDVNPNKIKEVINNINLTYNIIRI